MRNAMVATGPHRRLEIDDVLSLALKGEKNKGLALRDPRRLYNSSQEKFFKDISGSHKAGGDEVDYLYKTMADTLTALTIFSGKADFIHPGPAIRPRKRDEA